MAIGSENSVTVLIRTWIFMIIFCFAGYAAGSCLSYGHSCWGGHGKRSAVHNNAYLVPPKTLNEIQQGVPSLAKDQFVFSRLIGRPLVSNKYKGRWNRLFKIKAGFPENWDSDDFNAHLVSNEPIRDQNNNEDLTQGKRKHSNDVQDMTGNINDEGKEIPEILLISNNEDNQHGRKPQNVDLFKFLSDTNADFE
ncbi:hypothetical protein QLX08_002734 [Tetragonisca angustula]|uniref:Uncharacterized protein n=1 Tax=Tetragonisca angustula TaxID=166442 RepID=A0AAW1AA54_9HYME